MTPNPTRILALDPMTRGFGYVVFEEPFRLASFGRAYIEGEKHSGAIARFKELLADLRPDAVVFEDAEAPGSRRRHRARRIIDALSGAAREEGIPVHMIARTAVLQRFSPEGDQVTKRAIAEQLVRHFPELAPELPRRRKMWESEDDRMAIFDALSLAVTHATA
jgi:hypothetical protein